MPFRPHDPACDNFPDTSGVLLVMKTGASEAYDRIPTQLMTTLRCLPDFLLFSDMDQKIAGYHIREYEEGFPSLLPLHVTLGYAPVRWSMMFDGVTSR